MDVDCILWDHDGVLVDTEPFFFEATRATLLDFGVDLSREHWLRCQAEGRGMEYVVAALGSSDLDLPEIRRRRDDRYEQLLGDNDVWIDGAREVLSELGRDFRMALVTTSLRRFIDQLHGGTSALDHFDHVITAEDCARHKPHPEPYLNAMQLLDASPDRAVAVEDSERGLASAHNAGLRCFVVRNDFMSGSDFAQAHGRIDDLRELPPLLTVER